MTITAKMVSDLRERTGAGMMDCKKALTATDGNIEKAIDFLREKGLAAAAKKAGRIAAEGVVESYIHGNGRIGVLVEVNCETDFVASNPEFKEFCHDVAMQIAAASPECVRREDLDPALLAREMEVQRAKILNEGKPENMVDKIVTGKIEKYYKEVCLMEQPFVKNPDITISQLMTEKIAKIGENISIRRFARFVVGEGLEKKQSNLAEEVAALTKKN